MPLTSRLLLLAVLLSGIVSASERTHIQVVANASVPVSQLNPSQLRRIFSMQQTRWPGEQSIKVFVLSTDLQLHRRFCKEVLNMFPYQLERIWNQLVYSGLGELPTLVDTEQEMRTGLTQYPGAIGYMQKPVSDNGLKIILVERN